MVSAKWLPYQTMLAPLAAIIAKLGTSKTPEFGARLELLKRCFWCAVLGQQYESAPNSKSAKDVTELAAWLTGGEAPETVSFFKFDPSSLRDTTPRQRAVYRGTICLVLGCAGGARDFHTQSVITGKLIELEGIDDHHIFPAAYLEKIKGIKESRRRDCVLNRTLIDRTTNQIISDRAPSDYLVEIKQTPNFPFNMWHGVALPPSRRSIASARRRLRDVPDLASGELVEAYQARYGFEGTAKTGSGKCDKCVRSNDD